MDSEQEDTPPIPGNDLEAANTTPAGDGASPSDTPALPDPLSVDMRAPRQIPDYELVRILGHGGFGEVWLAKSRSGVYRAVKLLPMTPATELELEGVRLFQRHAEGLPN